MNIRFVEYGKRYIPHGSSDFIILARSDSEIEKSIDYFRRAILQFPRSTPFNEKIGNVTAGLLGLPEGYLFVQIQNRTEDEVKVGKFESTMRRQFNQIRFSYLSPDNLYQLFLNGIAVYTSLLFNNPSLNQKDLPYRLPDYGWFEAAGKSPSFGIHWEDRKKVSLALSAFHFEENVELLVDTINSMLMKRDMKGVVVSSELEYQTFDHITPLYYKLALLQEAQAFLYPRYGFLTFTLDYITDQQINIRFYGAEAARAENVDLTMLSQRNVDEAYHRLLKDVEHFFFDPKLAKYIRSDAKKWAGALRLYRLMKKQIKISSAEIKTLVKDHLRVLIESATNDAGIPEDLYSALSHLSFEEIRAWLTEESNDELTSYLFRYLKVVSLLDFVIAYLQLQKREFEPTIRPLFVDVIPLILPSDIQKLDKEQYIRFWKEALYIYSNSSKDIKLGSGLNILQTLLTEIYPLEQKTVERLIAREIDSRGDKFVNALLKESNIIAKKNPRILLQLVQISRESTTALPSDKDILKAYQQLYKGLLKIAISPDFQNQIAEQYSKEWSIFLERVGQKLEGGLIALITNKQEFNKTELENFVTVSSLVAAGDIFFAEWFFFAVTLRGSEHYDLFKLVYQAMRKKYTVDKLARLPSKSDDPVRSAFFYIMTLGSLPSDYSLQRSLTEGYKNATNIMPLFYTYLRVWIEEDWWTKDTRLAQEDIEIIIFDFSNSTTFAHAELYNNLLIKISKLQVHLCRKIKAEAARSWLTAAQKQWTNPKNQVPFTFYSLYTTHIENKRTINHLFDAVYALENPNAEFLWEISRVEEVSNDNLEISQEYFKLWNAKKLLFETGTEASEKVKEYLECAVSEFPESQKISGRLLLTLRKLIEVKHENITYSCKSELEANYLLLIWENVTNQHVANLARRFLERYLSAIKNVSEKLMLRLINSDLEIRQSLLRDYIDKLIGERRLETQINTMGDKAVLRLYKYALSISAQTSFIDMLERRLSQLDPQFKTRHSIDSLNTTRSEPVNKAEPNVTTPKTIIKSSTNSDENHSVEAQKAQVIKKHNNSHLDSRDRIDKLEEEVPSPVITITIPKSLFILFIIVLILFILINLALLWQYFIVIPRLFDSIYF